MIFPNAAPVIITANMSMTRGLRMGGRGGAPLEKTEPSLKDKVKELIAQDRTARERQKRFDEHQRQLAALPAKLRAAVRRDYMKRSFIG